MQFFIMGLFGNLFGKKQNENNQPNQPNVASQPQYNNGPTYQQPAYSQPSYSQPQPSGGLLNLKKNDILDLSKSSSSLRKIRVAAGWDVNDRGGSDYDLDLCAFLYDANDNPISSSNSLIYYGDKRGKNIYLDQDNLTGAGEGDDENIHVDLTNVDPRANKILFCVVIYQANSRNQSFRYVKNAYVRLVDEEAGERELCRYCLTEDGGSNTAVVFAEVFRQNNSWAFRAVGNYSCDTIRSLYDKIKKTHKY